MRRAPLFALVVGACTTGPPPAPTAGAPAPFASSGCADAAALTREATALLATGRLARATAHLEKAAAECPASRAPLRGLLAELEAKVGYTDRAAALLETMAKDPGQGPTIADPIRRRVARFAPRTPASPGDQEGTLATFDAAASAYHAGSFVEALAGYERVWESSHPNGEASLGAGLSALALGNHVDARWMLDRALVELRRPQEGDQERRVDVADFHEVVGIAFSADGHLVAVTGRGALIFDVVTRRLRASLGCQCESVAFDERSERLACGTSDGALRIHHAASGRLLSTFQALPAAATRRSLTAVAFSPDGRRVAFHGSTLGIVDLDSGQVRPLATGQDGTALAWSHDGRRLAAGELDGGVEIGTPTRRFVCRVTRSTVGAWSPSGSPRMTARSRPRPGRTSAGGRGSTSNGPGSSTCDATRAPGPSPSAWRRRRS